MISRGTRQRSSWINVNDDVTTAARLNSARFQATIYSASCVSYSPPTCSSTASRRYLLRVLFGDFSFPFFPSFLPSFSFPFPSPLPLFPFFISLLNGAHHNRIEFDLPNGNTLGNRYTYLIKDHCRVESLRSEDGISPRPNWWNFPCRRSLSRSPVFSNLPLPFFSPPKNRYFSSAFRFTTKIFYDLSNRLETTFCSSYRILNIFDKDSISCFWNVIL